MSTISGVLMERKATLAFRANYNYNDTQLMISISVSLVCFLYVSNTSNGELWSSTLELRFMEYNKTRFNINYNTKLKLGKRKKV